MEFIFLASKKKVSARRKNSCKERINLAVRRKDVLSLSQENIFLASENLYVSEKNGTAFAERVHCWTKIPVGKIRRKKCNFLSGVARVLLLPSSWPC